MTTRHRVRTLFLALFACISAPVLPGDSAPAPQPDMDPVYRAECGSCHIAYPPRLLSADAWGRVMANLEAHFGTDASLDATTRDHIAALLAANARRTPSRGLDGRPVERITESAWWVREHRPGHHGIGSGTFSHPDVGSAANCGACHRGADAGRIGEGNLHIPPAARAVAAPSASIRRTTP